MSNRGSLLAEDCICRDEHCMAVMFLLLAMVRDEHIDLRDPRSRCYQGGCGHALCVAVHEVEGTIMPKLQRMRTEAAAVIDRQEPDDGE